MSLDNEFFRGNVEQQLSGVGQAAIRSQQSMAFSQRGGLLSGGLGLGQYGLAARYCSSLTVIEEMRIEVDQYLEDWNA